MPRKVLITIVLSGSILLNMPVAGAAILFDDPFIYPGQNGESVTADMPEEESPAPPELPAPAVETEEIPAESEPVSEPADSAESPADAPSPQLTRGEAVAVIVSSFDLRKKFGSFVSDCLQHADECFFVFSAMSNYDGIQFSPLILYPDVFPAHRNYRAINIATMLGLVHGYLNEENSPFHPEIGMTKIQALKVVLGAGDMMKWKDRFEMTDEDYPSELPFKDPELQSPDAWWYARYLGFALDKGIVEPGESFGPDRPITESELKAMVEKTLSVN